ncbi:MAG: nitroreductase family protein [Bacteroidetes bacterium]|jgi:nitroreductase|nr:nitroreductase family protein [Bacteroidota bacterium]MBT4791254.1 nitroreductase family protein [Halobacteriovoraceae bacterium]MBT3747334.1 nitroreductase family protein [Bacteroidota bacterium]MBT4398348.1 nitroreductase family protein [Bacteroidota bacterium]MBT4408962.1 nitroreductase family protein [Bacteroidota bacterium]
MELYNGLLTRRSVRKYENRPVDKELITSILKAAMYAPSANNTQPWHFLVSRDKEIFKGFLESHPHSKMLMEAEWGILVLRNRDLQYTQGYGTTDCSAATQNILLAAHALGLGACWIGTYPRENRMAYLKEAFDLPDHLEAFAMVSIGWPASEPVQPNRFNENRIIWK